MAKIRYSMDESFHDAEEKGTTELSTPRHTKKHIAFTFDDGPDDIFSVRVLDILQRYDARATFFCLGQQVQRFPEVLKRMVRDGHSVGSHSWNHPHLSTLCPEAVGQQVNATFQQIQTVVGRGPVLFRPPYGDVDQSLAEYLQSLGYHLVLWDVDSQDWQGISGPKIAANVLASLHHRAIILQHTGAHAPGTIEALPYLIEVSRALDYEWVSVDELLAEAEDQPTLPSTVAGAAGSINQDQTWKESMP
ncbi:MAG: polysaccharide deacetylase family protein [Firmicutes bacterium]|nr:polysaccharide deacetylase family protein [Bacillota bacterium]